MSGINEKCPVCGGKIKNQIVKLDLWVEDSLIVIEDVPAEVCMVCGEEVYTLETSRKIDEIIRAKTAPKKEIITPVYSLA
jgi:HTH-type transcriptional regulator/antitoxin MqsA